MGIVCGNVEMIENMLIPPIDKPSAFRYPRPVVALIPEQLETAHFPLDRKVFLRGPASCGKTTTGIERLKYLLQDNIPGNSILVLTPQRTLQSGYQDLIQSPLRLAGGEVSLATIGGLARRICDLFWPLVSEKAGFYHPDRPPVFLTMETAQYYMARLVQPLIQERGYFDSITIDRNRLLSQIIDNLNKAAAIGFPHAEIGNRLEAAWFGDPSQRRVYADVQDCANRFRQYCLENNLLDFSLQLEVFWEFLWPEALVKTYLVQMYRHMIYDNVEEDIPRAHDLLHQWLPEFSSALLIYDEEAGFRRFLGADGESGRSMRDLCNQEVVFEKSFVNSLGIATLGNKLVQAITPGATSKFTTYASEPEAPRESLQILHTHFYPQLLDEVAKMIAGMIQSGLAPSEITILAPYLSDSLRFSITQRLGENNIPWRTHRPSRSLRDEPASHALLTLAAFAHPQWEVHPPQFDIAYALMQAINGLDLIRAQLLTGIVYREKEFTLAPFDGILSEVQERITYVIGGKYTVLRDWLLSYRTQESLPLDHFLRKLFGEVLSQPGFGFHTTLDSVRVAASLVESVSKFRQAVEGTGSHDPGREYLDMLQGGVIASQYLESWHTAVNDAVLVAPAYTFLMMNRPVSVQIWLDPGSSGWYERLSQPLTQPYVLSRNWAQQPGRVWSDADEVEASQHSLECLAAGLLRRCRSQVILALSELGESGYEQRGILLKAFQQVLQSR